MLQTKNINFNRAGAIILFGFLASAGISLAHSASAQATSLPTVTVTFMDSVGTTSLQPGQQAGSAGNFYTPVKIDMQNVAALSISVNAKSADLVGTTSNDNKIESVPSDAEYTINQMDNQWGYRWNFSDTINDTPINGSSPKNYQQMPTIPTLLDTIPIYGQHDTTTTKYLTLGFGVGVTGTTPADTYTNEVTVSVVATPRTVTIFDIAYMQDMTTDICYNTKTPTSKTISSSADINVGPDGATPYTKLIDADGSKQLLANATDYVPQKELIDKRDGKKYTVRKLADGNCWMVSNLEFDLVPTADKNTSAGTTSQSAFSATGTDEVTGAQITLTNEDTDLNSVTSWTPEIARELYGITGTVYKTQKNTGTSWGARGGVDGLHSFSSAAGYPSALYSTKTAASPTFGTANTGKPWQKFGNLYNWTAATLGSNTKATSDGQDATDSICPKGWKLPPKTGNGSFHNLLGTYGTTTDSATSANKIANFPLNFLRTGYYSHLDGSIGDRTVFGYWLSSARGDKAINVYTLNTTTSAVYPHGNGDGSTGDAIRCVAR